jgi:hypothetical protein
VQSIVRTNETTEEARMNRRAVNRAVVGCSLAVVLSAAGCSGDRSANRTAENNATGQPAAAGADRAGAPGSAPAAAAANGTAADENNARAPVTLTGCLQKGDGRSEYILTEVNRPRTSVGTSGSTGAGGDRDLVAQEQMREAAHAYKLSADRDTLEPLVGKQVRVSGTVERRSQLNEHNADGTLKDRDRTKIDADDLASVHVASIDSIADGCGGKSGARKR